VARADIRQHHVDINDIKSREQWRPLAPMVPAELFDRYFAGPRNPYMLMTCRTTTDRTPAVRHADGSARVQVLDDADDLIRGVTLSMESSGGVGVIVNTSLNGRNEPLYDDAEDAVGLLRRSPKMRFLLLQGTMISKP
jgi:carbamoyltransferase